MNEESSSHAQGDGDETGRLGTDVPLWVCPACDRTFANRNQTHTCAPLSEVDAHFARSEPHVRAIFDLVLDAVRSLGPVDVLAQRSRIALHVRMSFAAFTPRSRSLDGHLVLAREAPGPRWTRVETYSPRNVLHAFRLGSPEEVDEELRGWLAEAYDVGCQRHLR
jgi:Domain of unknown function (DUF5655)